MGLTAHLSLLKDDDVSMSKRARRGHALLRER
jgi:hypothetical protein